MVGGPADVVGRVVPILAALVRRWHHVGTWGDGTRLKLVTNLVLGLHRAALAEALGLAEAMGLDLATTLAVLRDSAAYSRVMDTKGDKMVRGDFTPQARLSQHLKDVRLILAEGERTGAKLPLSELHRRLLELVESLGLGDLDNSAILRAFLPPDPAE
jgi:3-hydroxyisobutyrate dehydrogenase-like beta-hydroxyacid dehydrogenase